MPYAIRPNMVGVDLMRCWWWNGGFSMARAIQKNKVEKDLTLLPPCTQTRDRTGMDCSTGVWDQRVYQFRHLGNTLLIAVQKYNYFFNPKKFCGKNFDASYLYYLLSDRFRRQKTYVRDVPYFTSASVIILRIWAKSSFLQIIKRLSFSMTR